MSTDLRVHLKRRQLFRLHTAISGCLAVVLLIIWVVTSGPFSYPWPEWPILFFAMALAVHRLFLVVFENPGRWMKRRMTTGFALHLGVALILSAMVTAIWVFAGRGYFWPVWPILSFAIALAIHWLYVLSRRIEHLEVRRSDAVEMQQRDLSRIERDLHDGAQARLVALGMNLGMAEQKFATDPDGARLLVSEAREGVGDALKELRDLVRGIRPPVLADRGLEAAISSLVDRSPITVHVASHITSRPTEPVETAAYFVVAEALTNAAKHARANRIDVLLNRTDNTLQVEVTDDGRGGADVAGHGLRGLRRRVEALDGHLFVASPAGGPTVIRAELPCGQ